MSYRGHRGDREVTHRWHRGVIQVTEVSQRGHTGPRKVTERSYTGHTKFTEMSQSGHREVTQRSLTGHREVTELSSRSLSVGLLPDLIYPDPRPGVDCDWLGGLRGQVPGQGDQCWHSSFLESRLSSGQDKTSITYYQVALRTRDS